MRQVIATNSINTIPACEVSTQLLVFARERCEPRRLVGVAFHSRRKPYGDFDSVILRCSEFQRTATYSTLTECIISNPDLEFFIED
jgi:hypothetical protein